MFDLNGVHINKTSPQSEQHADAAAYDVDLSLSIEKKRFESDAYRGTITINGDIYQVRSISSIREGKGRSITFVDDQQPLKYVNILFSLVQKDQFETVVIRHPDYILAGPAKTVEEAISRFEALYGTD